MNDDCSRRLENNGRADDFVPGCERRAVIEGSFQKAVVAEIGALPLNEWLA